MHLKVGVKRICCIYQLRHTPTSWIGEGCELRRRSLLWVPLWPALDFRPLFLPWLMSTFYGGLLIAALGFFGDFFAVEVRCTF